MRRLVIAMAALAIAAPLCGCVTHAAAQAVEAPGRVVGGLLGG